MSFWAGVAVGVLAIEIIEAAFAIWLTGRYTIILRRKPK